ncbi:hypothetical protein J9978_19315 [Chromobacterium violaceum]|uniref:hypothetical protein n=1 Tax=Chromobacterium violaceum TaxID=536 RepID=UPI001B337827|nr:hypothetical protein [Chromobacterium violaceum]MBP4051629.1 hypothetical protein [Chromobacterium violaceum]
MDMPFAHQGRQFFARDVQLICRFFGGDDGVIGFDELIGKMMPIDDDAFPVLRDKLLKLSAHKVQLWMTKRLAQRLKMKPQKQPEIQGVLL